MKEFFKKMLSGESETSSKRFNGTYGFAIYVALTIFVVLFDLLQDKKLEDYSITLLQLLALTSTGLLGLAAAVDGIKNKLTK